MKLPRKKRDETSATITQTLILIAACSALFALTAYATPPAWWTSRGAVNSSLGTNDYAVVNQGQLKQFTARAVDELNSDLASYGGAGTNLTNMVYGWRQDYATNGYSATNIEPSDYTAMNVGQLKYIANKVYGRLAAVGYTELTPSWLPQNTNSDNAAANLGQMKQVFDFDLSLPSASGLTATNAGTGTINLNWTLPSTNNATSWLVEEQTAGGTWNVITNLTNSTATSYSATGLTNGQSYAFQVIGSGTNTVSLPTAATGTPLALPMTGLALWLKADAGITPDGSGNASAWADQSPNGNNAAQSNSAIRPAIITSSTGGKPALHFTGSQYLTIPDSSSLRPSHYTILTVAKENSTATYQTLLARGYYSSGWSYPYISYDVSLFGLTSSNYLRSAITTGGSITEASGNNAYDLTRPHQFTWRYDGTNQEMFLSGTAATSTSTTGAIDYSGGASNITIGSRNDASPGEYVDADVSEILVYNCALTDTQRQQAEVYLADKYGMYHPDATWPLSYSSAVQSEIARNQWNKSQADAYATFLATSPVVPPTGLVLWLKADTGVATDGSQWADQGPMGNNAVQASSGNRPTPETNAMNGEPVVRFDGSTSYLTVPDNPSLDASTVTILAVYQVPNASDGTWIVSKPYRNSGWYPPYLSYGLGIGVSSGIQGLQISTSGVRTQLSSSFIAPANAPLLVTGIYDGTTMSLYNQGSLNGTASNSGNIDEGDYTEKDLCIGMHSSYSSGEYCQGDIAELLIYNRALTTTEQLQAEIYLANKYSATYSIAAPTITPNGGSFSSSTSVSFSSVPSPAVIRYTLDGTSPTSTSTLYSGAFTLTQSQPVTVAVFLNNNKISADASAQFYIGDSGDIGISDAWQIEYFGHTGISASALSPGGSGLTNLQCYLYGYNPTLYSTNGDGLSDLINYQLGYAGNNYDINGYGLTNAQQLALGLDPFDGVNPSQPTIPPGTSGDTVPPTITLTSPAGATLLP